MSELEEVSFWPGSSDGSYSRVGHANAPVVTCRRRTVLIIAAIIAVLFIIGIAIPAGMLTTYKNHVSEHANLVATTTAKPPAKGSTTVISPATSTPPLVTTTTKPDFPDFRLPINVMPRIYNIAIQLQLFGNETSKDLVIPYNGTVIMVLNVTDTTDRIVLHAVEMTLSKVQVAQCAEKEDYCYGFKDVESYNMTNGDLQQLQIKLDKKYSINTTLNLKIEFNTTLADNMRGFYNSSYKVTTDQTSHDRVIATTQFESVFARRAFPCFDEPSFKAKFALNITRPKNWISLFNSPLLDNTAFDESRTLDIYGLSPKMSSYLVAFVVCDFVSTNVTTMKSQISNETIDIKVYGQQSQISQLTYASEVAVTVINAYEDFFGIAYPLSKLDIVAIPNFAAGAMENWGLITFRESALLYDPESSSIGHKQYVTYVIAHELAHQWFGNLVTMEWWNELWLNEGFATFVGKMIGTEAAKDGDWPIAEDFRADVAGSLELDGLITSHPLSQEPEKVVTPDDIEAMFDDITYTKGSGILNMLYNFVSPTVTKKALTDYLSAHQYGNARAEDLWSSFDKAYKEEKKNAHDKAITNMMKTWTDSSGHPYVAASITNHGINVNQSRFFLCSTCNKSRVEESTWSVPMLYKTSVTSDSSKRYTFNKEEDMIPEEGDIDWALLNLNWTGYYHVLYANGGDLNTEVMTDIDLAGAVADMFLLFRSNHVAPDSFSKFLSSAVKSPSADYLTWKILLRSMWYLLDVYDQQFSNHHNLSTLFYKWLGVSHMDLSYEAVENMTIKDRTLLSGKLLMALNIDHEAVLKDIPYMTDLTTLWLNSIKNGSYVTDGVIHNDIAVQVWTCAYQSHESLDLWRILWKRYMTSSIASEQSGYKVVLASGIDNALLRNYLDHALTEAKDSETVGIISLVANNRRSRLDAWDFVKTNWAELIGRYADQGFTMETLIKSTTNYFSDSYKLRDMQEFFSANDLGAGERASRQSLEVVEANTFMMDELSEDFLSAILKVD